MKDLEVKLDIVLEKHKEIEKKLSDQNNFDTNKSIKLNKEYSELTPLVQSITEFKTCQNEINNLKELLDENDVTIREMAESELKEANLKLKLFEKSLLKLLIPKDHNDQKNSILEIRAGTGGDEASLFAADLFSMYKKYSDLNNWKCEILSISETGLNGIKEVICSISGKSVFSKLKYESGVHRVQRVPLTETSGARAYFSCNSCSFT